MNEIKSSRCKGGILNDLYTVYLCTYFQFTIFLMSTGIQEGGQRKFLTLFLPESCFGEILNDFAATYIYLSSITLMFTGARGGALRKYLAFLLPESYFRDFSNDLT